MGILNHWSFWHAARHQKMRLHSCAEWLGDRGDPHRKAQQVALLLSQPVWFCSVPYLYGRLSPGFPACFSLQQKFHHFCSSWDQGMAMRSSTTFIAGQVTACSVQAKMSTQLERKEGCIWSNYLCKQMQVLSQREKKAEVLVQMWERLSTSESMWAIYWSEDHIKKVVAKDKGKKGTSFWKRR
jgi:hypothetical protein